MSLVQNMLNIIFFIKIINSIGYVVSAFTMPDKKWICEKSRPDTAKPLAFLKSASKTTSEASNSLQTSKISQPSVIHYSCEKTKHQTTIFSKYL